MEDHEYVRPEISLSLLRDLLVSNYNLKLTNYKELNSHEDSNFHITCKTIDLMKQKSDFNQPFCEEKSSEFVVKVMHEDLFHSEEFSRRQKIQVQMKVMRHLLNCGFICPEVVPSHSGSLIQKHGTSDENVNYLIYLTKYIHGSTLLDFAPLSSGMLYEIGNLLAQLHCSLKDVAVPSTDLLSVSPWALENAFKIKDFVAKVELSAEEQILISNVLDHFSEVVLAQKKELPHGIIHGDFHDENILLLEGKENASTVKNEDFRSFQNDCIRSKYAVIDFGDVSYSPLVFDLAISASYFMMCNPLPDFVEQIGHFLHGYFTTCKPTSIEIQSLFASICAAYCREVVLAKYSFLEQSRSNAYLVTAVDAGLRQLKDIWLKGKNEVIAAWSEIGKTMNYESLM